MLEFTKIFSNKIEDTEDVMKKGVCCIFLALFLGIMNISYSKQTPPPQFTNTAQDFYGNILKAYQKQDWRDVIFNAKCLFSYFPNSPFSSEASYYQGVAFFVLHDFDFANQSFSRYLKNEATPKFFDEAISYKYKIALKFQNGHKRHLMGAARLPKWLPAKEEALEIYDEIITTLPRHDLAARSLYQKGGLLASLNDYKASIDSFQVLIRRFPKHELAPDSFLGIADVYLKQCQSEFPDPDILELVQVNLEKFEKSFPGEPRIKEAEKKLLDMRNFFAKDLYEVGSFYERTKKFEAAEIYYSTIISQYPQTKYAIKAKKHIDEIKRKIEKTKKK